MKILPGKEEEYANWKATNEKDGIGAGAEIFRYLEAWADLMEARMAEGEKLEDIVEETSRLADTNGITGSMYGFASSVLCQEWLHGNELHQWQHNKMEKQEKERQEWLKANA